LDLAGCLPVLQGFNANYDTGQRDSVNSELTDNLNDPDKKRVCHTDLIALDAVRIP
jgi:hypothetical protein